MKDIGYENEMYVDTDSIITTKPYDFLNDTKVGYFKDE